MTRRTTPHGDPMPDNANRLGRPPRTLLDNENTRELLSSPGLLAKLRHDQRIDPSMVNEFITDLRQHRRAMSGDRMRPGEWNGDDSLPHQPMPFAPPETFRPDREPGSENYELYRGAVEQLDASLMTEKLQRQMRENDPDNGYWARSAPASGSSTAKLSPGAAWPSRFPSPSARV